MLRVKVVLAVVILAAGILEGTTYGVVSGFVRDRASGDYLGYVNVFLENHEFGTTTSKEGHYSISGIPEGRYVLICSMIGFREERKEIVIERGRNIRVDFFLSSEPLELGAVEVFAEHERFEHEVDIGVKHIDIERIRDSPTLGQEDIFRSMSVLPGVVSVSDFTSALYVRGGASDQNLVLLDGIQIYNPHHLLGVFSSFIIESLDGVELYTGGFPARFGGAASSVLDIKMRKGDQGGFKATSELGLLSSKLTLEGPLPWIKGSWIVSGRRTYLDLATWAIEELFHPESLSVFDLIPDELNEFGFKEKPFYFPYYFYDVQTHLNVDLGRGSELSLSGFLSDDVFDYREKLQFMEVKWGNTAAGLNWRHPFSPNLMSETGISFSRHAYDNTAEEKQLWIEDTMTQGYAFRSSIEGIRAKWSLSWFAGEKHTLLFGCEGGTLGLVDNNLQYRTYPYDSMREENEWADRFWNANVYVEDKWTPSAFWIVEGGLRGEYFSGGNYFRPSPRIGVKRLLSDRFALKAGAGLYYQYFHDWHTDNELYAKLPVFLEPYLLASDTSHPPLQAGLCTLGAEYLLNGKASISAEVYYKDLRNLWGVITPGQGCSYGADVQLKYQKSWVSYSYSITRERFNGDWFYPMQDSRHNVNLSLTLPLKKGWQVTAAWVLNSGFPYKGVIGFYQATSPEGYDYLTPILDFTGNYRYPAYHRLDLGMAKSFTMFKKIKALFYFQVINAYGRHNILSYSVKWSREASAMYLDPIYMLPLPVPNFGIRVEF